MTVGFTDGWTVWGRAGLRTSIASAVVAAIFGALAGLGGCGSSGPATPRMRLGSIPFPGTMTLYTVADPNNLGVHRYEGWLDSHTGPDETDRGIMYSCRAGFLDLSHIRESMDIVKYAHDRILELMVSADGMTPREGGVFVLDWADAKYEMCVCVPEGWAGTEACERKALAEEAAIMQAQRFCVIVGTWHELGTWYGQETVPPFSEKTSAFTWDDTTSHVVASIVAGKALHDTERKWNEAVTAALASELAELGVVDIASETQAVEAVRGVWWRSGDAIRRDLDTGLSGGFKTPWIVQGLECCGGIEATPLPVVDLSNVRGLDMRCCFGLRIFPARWLLRKALGCDDCPIAVTTEGEILQGIERMRALLKAEYGPDADHP